MDRFEVFFFTWMFLLITSLPVRAAQTYSQSGSVRELNICTEEEELRCPDGQVIAVQEVTCGARGRPCKTSFNQSLADICQGHQTCSNLGLRDMFSSHCVPQQSGVTAKYICVSGQTALCHANICAKESHGLVCPPDTVLHIRRVTCSDGDADCAWSSYNLLTSLCEGSPHCDASGLREDLLSPHCTIGGGGRSQVLVDYLCVPGELIHKLCAKNPEPLNNTGFGIITLPKLNKKKPNKMCKWEIPSDSFERIKVSWFLVQQSVDKPCEPDLLRIQYTDCMEQRLMRRSFCDFPKSRMELESCGPVELTSSPSTERQFIISFQGSQDSSQEGFLSSGLPSCIAPPAPTHTPNIQTLPAKPEDISQKALHDLGPENANEEQNAKSGSFKLTLKMLLLYIFLGALILILLAALVTILVRYKRMSLPRYKFGDSSENVMLWRRYEDTAMDIFQQNSVVNPTGSIASDTAPSSNQVIATVHRDAAIDFDDMDNRMSLGSGISSFLPPKRDSGFKDFLESIQMEPFEPPSNPSHVNDDTDRKAKSVSKYDFYDLPEETVQSNVYLVDDNYYGDIQFGGHYSNPNSLTRPQKASGIDSDRDHHIMPVEDHQPLVQPVVHPKDDYHYRVNDDDYAFVNKSSKTAPKGIPVDSNHRTTNGFDSCNGSSNFHPASGPYEQSSHSATMSKNREPGAKVWRDEY